MLTRPMLFFNTVRYLKFRQIINRVKRNFLKPRVLPTGPPDIALLQERLEPVIKCQQKISHNGALKFLNKEFNLSMIDDWNPSSQEKLWIYNLHYFDDLNSVDSEKRFSLHGCLIQKWIDENPIGFGSGWEPYPSSLRIVNWIKWALFNNGLEKKWLDSLTIQVRFLSNNLEYHLLGNHLFVNAKALIFAGLYFQGSEPNEWYQSGINILNDQLSEQVLSDGGNFELSPMYHIIFLEDLLDIVNIHQAYRKPLPKTIISKALQMFEWLKCMCHPDGEIAFFNDSTLGATPTLAELVDYAKRLKVSYIKTKEEKLTYLKDSGYIRATGKEFVLIADVADIGPSYLPGHGHADALSFELSLFGRRIIVNSGVSTYENCLERINQRGTKAHSTISIDDKNSSEVWSGFRVARRAKIFDIKTILKDSKIIFSACHDGYKRLKGSPVHSRKWSITEEMLLVTDKIIGSGKHRVTSVLPLHPGVLVSEIQENCVDLEIDGKRIKVCFEGKGSLIIAESHYHPEFGLSIKNKKVIFSYNGLVPLKTKIRISW